MVASGIAVVILAFIPLTVPPDHWAWQCAIWMAMAVAILAIVIQVIAQASEDKKTQERERVRDGQYLEILSHLQQRQLGAAPAPSSLRGKTIQLAQEIFDFLRDLPPHVETAKGRTFEEIFHNARVRDNGRVEQAHHGYMHRFRERVINLAHELAEAGIQIAVQQWEIDPPEIQRERNLRRIADELAVIAARMPGEQ